MPYQMTNIGSEIAARAGGSVSAVAGGSGDATEVSSAWFERTDMESLVFFIYYKATLAQDETLTLTANVQTASDSSGTGAADFGDALASAVVATGPSGGGTVEGVSRIDVNLQKSTAGAYVRGQFTPDLSAANTDTAILAGVFVVNGEPIPVV